MQRAKSLAAVAATLLAGVGILATGNIASAAGAASARGAPREATVRYGDLDLTRPADVEVLYDRLRSAARRVCGKPGGRDLRDSLVVRQCYRYALDRAVAGIDLAELAARHPGSGRRLVAAAKGITQSR